MRRFWLILLLSLAVPGMVLAAEPVGQLLQDAEANFAKGIELKDDPDQARNYFSKAAEAYRELYEQGINNPELCRNWGQAEVLADRLPQAIFAWRLGLLLSPADADLLANIEYARDQVEYPPGNVGRPPANLWPAWLLWFGFATVMALALLCYAALWALGTCWLANRHPIFFWSATIAFLLLLALVGGGVALAIEERDNQLYPPVVILKEHVLHRGNGVSYAPHEKIPVARPGMEARLLFQRGGWLQIEFAGGHVGWVPESAALVAP